MHGDDKCYCATPCDQKDCERNLNFYKPTEEYYSVMYFDGIEKDKKRKDCRYKIRKEK